MIVALQVEGPMGDAEHDLHLFVLAFGTLKKKIKSPLFHPKYRFDVRT